MTVTEERWIKVKEAFGQKLEKGAVHIDDLVAVMDIDWSYDPRRLARRSLTEARKNGWTRAHANGTSGLYTCLPHDKRSLVDQETKRYIREEQRVLNDHAAWSKDGKFAKSVMVWEATASVGGIVANLRKQTENLEEPKKHKRAEELLAELAELLGEQR